MRLAATLVSILVLMQVGCEVEDSSLPIKRSEIIGTYVANYHAGLLESISLREDSSYTYYFLSRDSEEFAIESRWTLLYDMGRSDRPRVVLLDFITPYALDGMCFCDDCTPKFMRRDSTRYAYGISAYKNGTDPIVLRRCTNRNQYYVKTMLISVEFSRLNLEILCAISCSVRS